MSKQANPTGAQAQTPQNVTPEYIQGLKDQNESLIAELKDAKADLARNVKTIENLQRELEEARSLASKIQAMREQNDVLSLELNKAKADALSAANALENTTQALRGATRELEIARSAVENSAGKYPDEVERMIAEKTPIIGREMATQVALRQYALDQERAKQISASNGGQ